jgi:hypothetical protein
LAVHPIPAARNDGQLSRPQRQQLIERTLVRQDVARLKRYLVLAKELLSAQAAGSTRLPIHFDGVSRRRGRRRHCLLPLVGKKSSIAAQPSQPITETHVPTPGQHDGRHPRTAGMASSHRISPVRRCASSVVCSTWRRGPRGNEIGAPCVRPRWDRQSCEA